MACLPRVGWGSGCCLVEHRCLAVPVCPVWVVGVVVVLAVVAFRSVLGPEAFVSALCGWVSGVFGCHMLLGF